ncbi:MAG: sugar phosphate isomerase/epimerase [Planctomycetes bacterium]|nr:sugar phosphate isomerase/epimerase [Planctomycetota bacterium]
MLKAINAWSLRRSEARSAESLLDEVRAHGFDGFEPTIGEQGLITPETCRAACEAVATAARDAGLTLTSLASGLGWRLPLTSDDERVRTRAGQIIRRSLHAAAWLGVDVLLVVPGQLAMGESGHVPYDVAMARMKEGIGRLVPVAEDLGVTLGIENVWNQLLLSPLEMRDFIDGFHSDRVGAYLDVGNMILFGYAEDWVRILGPRISSVHFKDFKRSVGTLEGFCDLLEGDVNYPAVMEALREAAYDGPVVAEFFELDSQGLDRVSRAMDRILAT